MGRAVLATASALIAAAILVVGAGAGTGTGASTGTDTFVTVLQAKKRFKLASGGYILQRNKNASYPGHYVALDLGVPTISKKVKFGQFTLYLIVKRGAQEEVDELLADTHTGVLGQPNKAGIHWEQGKTLHGENYWLAKKRYGDNLVVWWYGGEVKKIDRAFANLNKILKTKVAVGAPQLR